MERDAQSNEKEGDPKSIGMEADFAFRCVFSGDELFDGVEDDEEMWVVFGVFLFEGFDFFGEQGVGVHEAAELDEGAHDGDVHFHGAWRAQDAGEHGDTLFGEGVGEVFAVLAAL